MYLDYPQLFLLAPKTVCAILYTSDLNGILYGCRSLLYIFSVYIPSLESLPQVLEIHKLTASKSFYFSSCSWPSGQNQYFLIIVSEIFQNRKEISITRKNDCSIKAIFLFGKHESHIYVTICFTNGVAFWIVIGLYWFEY